VDDDSYTHVVLLNLAMPERLLVSRDRVLGLAFEPPQLLPIDEQFVEYASRYIGRYLIGGSKDVISEGDVYRRKRDYWSLRQPFMIAFAPLWHCGSPLASSLLPISRRRPCSIMVSQKQWAPGHIYRHELARAILDTDLPVDIWGRGCESLQRVKPGDPRLRGSFLDDDCRIYGHYLFHIAIENFQTPCYVSEKLLNPLIYESTPLYLGATVAAIDLFEGHFITLSGTLDLDVQMIRSVITSPELFMRNPMERGRLMHLIHPLREIEKMASCASSGMSWKIGK
jgi:hypothetical protein